MIPLLISRVRNSMDDNERANGTVRWPRLPRRVQVGRDGEYERYNPRNHYITSLNELEQSLRNARFNAGKQDCNVLSMCQTPITSVYSFKRLEQQSMVIRMGCNHQGQEAFSPIGVMTHALSLVEHDLSECYEMVVVDTKIRIDPCAPSNGYNPFSSMEEFINNRYETERSEELCSRQRYEWRAQEGPTIGRTDERRRVIVAVVRVHCNPDWGLFPVELYRAQGFGLKERSLSFNVCFGTEAWYQRNNNVGNLLRRLLPPMWYCRNDKYMFEEDPKHFRFGRQAFQQEEPNGSELLREVLHTKASTMHNGNHVVMEEKSIGQRKLTELHAFTGSVHAAYDFHDVQGHVFQDLVESALHTGCTFIIGRVAMTDTDDLCTIVEVSRVGPDTGRVIDLVDDWIISVEMYSNHITMYRRFRGRDLRVFSNEFAVTRFIFQVLSFSPGDSRSSPRKGRGQ